MNLAFRLARREMRSGLGGFRLFIACLALGVAAIAAILSFSRAVEEGLRADAREILSGDIAVSLLYREATPEQIDYMKSRGELVRWIDSRAMARPVKPDGRATLVQLKAVERGYPLYGSIELKDGLSLADALADKDGVWGAVVEESALRRMNMAVGERVKVGDVTVEVRGIIAREPDRGLNAFASLGPRLMISYEAVSASGLVQPGSLLNYEYRLRLPPGISDLVVIDGLKSRFPDAGWRVRGLAEAGGGIRFWLDRLTQFIGLIGLSSLLVGGVGVGNAISSFLAGRLRTIAILKCLGAPERLVFSTYLIQLSALALVGVVLGLVIGAALPFVAQSVIADVLPVRARVALYAWPLTIAAIFGLLVSLLFALMPLLRARRVSAATLMRGAVVQGGSLVWRDALLIGAVALALAGFTIFTADSRRIAGWFVLGAIGAFIAFPLLARLLMLAAARAGKPKLAGLRLALANLHRPGAPTPIVMLSLGLGLTVLVATALIEGNLREQITKRIPSDAPAFFFVDIQSTQMPAFEKALAAIPGAGPLDKVPSLRGRITKIGGKPVNEIAVPSDARWAIDGDRGVTYSATPPEGSRIVAGEWWPADYRGPQLISFDEAAGQGVRAGAGRHHHGERAGPRHRGQDRLLAAHRMDDAHHQLRLRLFARPLGQGAAHLPRHGEGHARGRGCDLQGDHRPVPQRHRGAHPRRHRDGGERAGQYRAGQPRHRLPEHPGGRAGAGRRHAGDPAAPGARGRGDEGAGRHAGAHRRHLRLGIRGAGARHRAGGAGRGHPRRLSRGAPADGTRLDLPADRRRGGGAGRHGAHPGVRPGRDFGSFAAAAPCLAAQRIGRKVSASESNSS